MVRVVRLSGLCDIEKLRDAANRATKGLPLLASTIVRHRGKPMFARVNNFQSCIESIERDSPNSWQREVEQQIGRRIENGGPQWRMTVVHSAASQDWELLLAYNHAIADPVTATVHLERILEEYCHQTSSTGEELAETEIIQPLESLLHKEWSLRNTVKFIINDLRLKRLQKKMACFIRPKGIQASIEVRKTNVRFACLPAEQTTKILQMAKQQQVSFQGLLLAAMIRASEILLHNRTSPCLTQSNISLRNACGPGNYSREPGCFIFWFMNSIPRESADGILSLAKICSEKVRTSIPDARPPSAALGVFTGKSIEQLVTGDNFGRISTVGVSNIGPTSLPEQIGNITIREDYTITSQRAVGPEAMLLASTFAGRLHLTLCFVEPLLSPEQMDGYRDRLIAELTSFTRTC